MTISVTARLSAKPGCATAIAQAMAPLTAATRQETGCIDYIPHVNPEAPNEFCFIERWESKEALDKHLASAHIEAFRKATGDLVDTMEVIVWDPIFPTS